jgi:hypothetical protein
MRFLKKLFLVSVLCISAAGCFTPQQRAAYQAQLDAQQAQYNACTQDDRCRQERQFQQTLQAQQQAQYRAQQPQWNMPSPAPLNGGGITNTRNTVCTSYVPGTVQCQSN